MRYRDGNNFRVVSLVPAPSPLYIGRDEGCAVEIRHDERVSRAPRAAHLRRRSVVDRGRALAQRHLRRRQADGRRAAPRRRFADHASAGPSCRFMPRGVRAGDTDGGRLAGAAAAASECDPAQGARRAGAAVHGARPADVPVTPTNGAIAEDARLSGGDDPRRDQRSLQPGEARRGTSEQRSGARATRDPRGYGQTRGLRLEQRGYGARARGTTARSSA